jgi:hypothetical protein
MTLVSAKRIHERVVLIHRPHDDAFRTNARAMSRHWHESQDFQSDDMGANYLDQLPAGVEIRRLQDVAPEIAAIRAPDVQTSDLLAWWLLAHHGGSVADMDVLFLRDLPPVTHDVHAVVCTGWPRAGYMPIGFLQGRPCHFWREMFRRSVERYDPTVYESCGAGMFPAWAEIPEPKQLLSEYAVYPFALKAEWMRWHDWMFEDATWPDLPAECFGVHWYGGKNQEYNRALTRENYRARPGLISWAIAEVLGE